MSSTVDAGDFERLGMLCPDRGVPVPCRLYQDPIGSDPGEGMTGEWLGFADSLPRRTVMSARADYSIHVGIELAEKSTHSAMMSVVKRGLASASRKR